MKVRYIIHRDNELYIARTLEYGLACQAHTRQECHQKIRRQIDNYVHDIHYSYKDPLVLLDRKASLGVYLLYYTACFLPIRFSGGRFYLEGFSYYA